MRVTRLEIFGFKSFVERFVLNFDHNMIGVVGPNGCGKSNIVDALRWVLGETHAKHLRGSLFDDLIFNGSEGRRPLGMAEVNIVVRPTEGWANGHPVLTMPAENLNGLAATQDEEPRLEVDENLDVLTSVIEQDGEQRHLPSEEALLNAKPSILTEIPGLLDASEIQFTRRLYRSGESEYFINRVACRLRDMTDMYRLIGLGARGLSIVQQGEINKFISCKPIERRELLEEAAGISGFRTRMEAAQRRLEKTSENMARLQDIMSEVEKQVRFLSRQAKRARERNELKAELRSDELELFNAKVAKIDQSRSEALESVARLTEECENAQAELNLAEAGQGELQAKLEEIEVKLSDDRRERDSLQAMLNGEQARLNDLRLGLALVEGRLESAQSLLGRFSEQENHAREEIARRLSAIEKLRPQLQVANDKKLETETALKELQVEHEQRRAEFSSSSASQLEIPAVLLSEIEHLRRQVEERPVVEAKIREIENHIQKKRSSRESLRREHVAVQLELARTQSEHAALERQLTALAENVAQMVPASASASGSSDDKVLLSVLKVPEHLQRAVHAVLGERGQFLIRQGAHASSRDIPAGKKARRMGLIEKNSPRRALSAAAVESLKSTVSSAKLLEAEIGIQAGYEAACQALLGGVVVVDELADAVKAIELLQAQNESDPIVVTASGAVFTAWGWFTTEGEGQAFSFGRQLAELADRMPAQQAKAAELEEQGKAEEAEMEALEGERLGHQETLRGILEVEQRLRLRLEEQRRLEREAEEARRGEENKIREELLVVEREVQERLRAALSESSRIQGEIGLEERRVSDLQAEIASMGNERHGVQEDLESLRKEKHRIEVDLERGVENSKLDVEQIRIQMGRLDEALRALEEKRRPIRLQVAEVAERVATVRRKSQELQEQFGRANLGLERIDIELNMLREDVGRQYPDAPAPTATQLQEIVARANGDIESLIGELQESAAKIRRRMEREGEVDPQSIELFDQEEARLLAMQTQYEDLDAASGILSRTIRQLKEISRDRFLATFKSVNEKFQVLLPRLFGGGAGYLELVNPEDPLASGVELVVRPPGKKLTNMELLSGGEKALVAISVLMSMFLHRPSPLCVLDEVDAPLDEANLERYLGLISEISKGTQFLMITHNKRSMAEAGRLVGITMQEKGVSTALSVTLEESSEEIDRWVANA